MNDGENRLSRRGFLEKGVIGGLFFGMGCRGSNSMDNNSGEPKQVRNINGFQSPSDFTYEKLFNFTFSNWFISYMKGLEKEMGSEKLNELLTQIGDEHYRKSVGSMFSEVKDRSVQSLIENFWEPTMKSDFGSSTIKIEIPTKSKNTCTVKMTECLFAKTFRDNDAGEMGYAAICHADFAVADEFNPDIVLKRDKCLMKGDDCCLFNYSMGKES